MASAALFRGLSVCFTGFDAGEVAERQSLEAQVARRGGDIRGALDDRVSVVVCRRGGTAKHHAALKHGIPVLRLEWLITAIRNKHLQGFTCDTGEESDCAGGGEEEGEARTGKPPKRLRGELRPDATALAPFVAGLLHGYVVSTTGFSSSENATIEGAVTRLGGVFTRSLDRRSLLLVKLDGDVVRPSEKVRFAECAANEVAIVTHPRFLRRVECEGWSVAHALVDAAPPRQVSRLLGRDGPKGKENDVLVSNAAAAAAAATASDIKTSDQDRRNAQRRLPGSIPPHHPPPVCGSELLVPGEVHVCCTAMTSAELAEATRLALATRVLRRVPCVTARTRFVVLGSALAAQQQQPLRRLLTEAHCFPDSRVVDLEWLRTAADNIAAFRAALVVAAASGAHNAELAEMVPSTQVQQRERRAAEGGRSTTSEARQQLRLPAALLPPGEDYEFAWTEVVAPSAAQSRVGSPVGAYPPPPPHLVGDSATFGAARTAAAASAMCSVQSSAAASDKASATAGNSPQHPGGDAPTVGDPTPSRAPTTTREGQVMRHPLVRLLRRVVGQQQIPVFGDVALALHPAFSDEARAVAKALVLWGCGRLTPGAAAVAEARYIVVPHAAERPWGAPRVVGDVPAAPDNQGSAPDAATGAAAPQRVTLEWLCCCLANARVLPPALLFAFHTPLVRALQPDEATAAHRMVLREGLRAGGTNKKSGVLAMAPSPFVQPHLRQFARHGGDGPGVVLAPGPFSHDGLEVKHVELIIQRVIEALGGRVVVAAAPTASGSGGDRSSCGDVIPSTATHVVSTALVAAMARTEGRPSGATESDRARRSSSGRRSVSVASSGQGATLRGASTRSQSRENVRALAPPLGGGSLTPDGHTHQHTCCDPAALVAATWRAAEAPEQRGMLQVVSLGWLEASAAVGYFVDETPFLLSRAGQTAADDGQDWRACCHASNPALRGRSGVVRATEPGACAQRSGGESGSNDGGGHSCIPAKNDVQQRLQSVVTSLRRLAAEDDARHATHHCHSGSPSDAPGATAKRQHEPTPTLQLHESHPDETDAPQAGGTCSPARVATAATPPRHVAGTSVAESPLANPPAPTASAPGATGGEHVERSLFGHQGATTTTTTTSTSRSSATRDGSCANAPLCAEPRVYMLSSVPFGAERRVALELLCRATPGARLVAVAQQANVVVCDEIRVRESVLVGCARGALLVTPDYVTACGEAGRLLDPSPFAWSESGVMQAFGAKLLEVRRGDARGAARVKRELALARQILEAAAHWREVAAARQPLALAGVAALLWKVEPHVGESYAIIIAAAGGSVLVPSDDGTDTVTLVDSALHLGATHIVMAAADWEDDGHLLAAEVARRRASAGGGAESSTEIAVVTADWVRDAVLNDAEAAQRRIVYQF